MKFRKKPVVIEARQITLETFTDVPSDEHFPGIIYDPITLTVIIHTREGTMTGQIGDWIIEGVQGELYPCKPDIFACTYEKVPDEV